MKHVDLKNGRPIQSGRLGFWLGLSALTLIQVGCQSNPPAAEPHTPSTAITPKTPEAAQEKAAPAPALVFPEGLDLKDLDSSERQTLHELLSELYDPCGKPRSFLESLQDPKTCAQAKPLAELAVAKLTEGLSKRQVSQAILKEQARTANKASFDLSESPYAGDPKSSKVIVEFFDYQCPHCRSVAKPAKEAALKAGAVLYYKMMPLNHHPFAREAAHYALAAARQGKFEAMHTLIFENAERLSSEVLRELAKQAQLDLKALEKELQATGPGSVAALVERDLAEADTLNVGGTPTFYLNGYEVEFANLEGELAAPTKP